MFHQENSSNPQFQTTKQNRHEQQQLRLNPYGPSPPSIVTDYRSLTKYAKGEFEMIVGTLKLNS